MLVDYSLSWASVLPAIIALVLAIATRRVVLSLGVGIVVGSMLLNAYSIADSIAYIFHKVIAIFINDIPENSTQLIEDKGIISYLYNDLINSSNTSIIVFLILLGMTTAILTLSGGTRAFADWAQRKISSKRDSQLLAAFLGVFIFVDDYFNSLAVGSIAKPVTDRFGVSRAKLAYILDSTAAPMCVIMPASSWGAYIMVIVAGILTSHGITNYTPLGAYVELIFMNYYAIFALLMVFVVAIWDINIGQMKHHENHAEESKDDQNPDALKEDLDIDEGENGRPMDLILPIAVLVIATVATMIYTGYTALAADGHGFSLLGAFENTNVSKSLVIGGLVGLLSTFISLIRQRFAIRKVGAALWIGAKSMFPAIVILIFAWTIGAVIKDMKTGAFLSSLVENNVNIRWLPAILFVLSGLMAFATGTSWGTFAIMLPLAGDIAGQAHSPLMLPVLGAVLAGSVFGDHCSPISDTTILSSTGAGCKHIDHVATQLPYALVVALVSVIGYIVLGYTDSMLISFAAAFVAFIVACNVLHRVAHSNRRDDALDGAY